MVGTPYEHHRGPSVKPDMSRFNPDHDALYPACTQAAARHMHEVWSQAAELTLLGQEPLIPSDPLIAGLLATAGFFEPSKVGDGMTYAGAEVWRVLRLEESKPLAEAQNTPPFRKFTGKALSFWDHDRLATLGYEQIRNGSNSEDWRLRAYWHRDDYSIVAYSESTALAYPKTLLPIRNARIILTIADKRAKGDLDTAMERAPAWMTSPAEHYKHEGMFLLEHDDAMPLAKEMLKARKPSMWTKYGQEYHGYEYPKEWDFPYTN